MKTAEDLQRKALIWVICAIIAGIIASGVFVWVVISASLKALGLL